MIVTEKNRCSIEERQNNINFSLTFEKREDKKISGICGTEVASHETNDTEVSLFGCTVWVKKYVHLRTESKRAQCQTALFCYSFCNLM